jgi:nicotinate-nucleotide pyrophosphorylase (carboxylating)
MLDDFSPDEVREACDLLPTGQRPEIEVSGGITLKNVRGYAEAGADRISSGALTHSAPALDFSMRVSPAPTA